MFNARNIENYIKKLCLLEERGCLITDGEQWGFYQSRGGGIGSAVTLANRDTCTYWLSCSLVNKVEKIPLNCFLDTFFTAIDWYFLLYLSSYSTWWFPRGHIHITLKYLALVIWIPELGLVSKHIIIYLLLSVTLKENFNM